MCDDKNKIMNEIKSKDASLDKLKEEQIQNCENNKMHKELGKDIKNKKEDIDDLLGKFNNS